MKKFFVSCVLLFVSSIMLADNLTATLQQGDEMTAYYGADAFKQAYEAAGSSGAIITLSAGTFNEVESIEKSMTIIGYNAFDTPKTTIKNMKIMADDVLIEGIYFSYNLILGRISNCHIKRCYVNNDLTASVAHTNTFVDQCVVKYDYAVGTGVNYVIKNSTLSQFKKMNTTDNMAQISNCVIWNWYYYHSITSTTKSEQPYAIYINNVLGGYYLRYSPGGTTYDGSVTVSAPSEFYYNLSVTVGIGDFYVHFEEACINEGNDFSNKHYANYFSNGEESYPASTLKKTSTGMDGTTMGIYGGTGFSKLPSIPRITSSTVDSHTDSQGIINVSISASTNN